MILDAGGWGREGLFLIQSCVRNGYHDHGIWRKIAIRRQVGVNFGLESCSFHYS